MPGQGPTPSSSASKNSRICFPRAVQRLTLRLPSTGFWISWETNPEWCRLVEVKYFLGLTDEEAADAMGIKLRTMQRMWRDARQWLFENTEPGNARKSAARKSAG